MRRKTFGIIFGALLVAAGVILALKEFGVMQIDSSVFEGWWSLFIIVPAIDGLIRNKEKNRQSASVGNRCISFACGARHNRIWYVLAAFTACDCGIVRCEDHNKECKRRETG